MKFYVSLTHAVSVQYRVQKAYSFARSGELFEFKVNASRGNIGVALCAIAVEAI